MRCYNLNVLVYNWVGAMATDVLAPYIAMSSSAMLLAT